MLWIQTSHWPICTISLWVDVYRFKTALLFQLGHLFRHWSEQVQGVAGGSDLVICVFNGSLHITEVGKLLKSGVDKGSIRNPFSLKGLRGPPPFRSHRQRLGEASQGAVPYLAALQVVWDGNVSVALLQTSYLGAISDHAKMSHWNINPPFIATSQFSLTGSFANASRSPKIFKGLRFLNIAEAWLDMTWLLWILWVCAQSMADDIRKMETESVSPKLKVGCVFALGGKATVGKCTCARITLLII